MEHRRSRVEPCGWTFRSRLEVWISLGCMFKTQKRHSRDTDETLNNQVGITTWPGNGVEALSSATPALATGYTEGIAIAAEVKGVHEPTHQH